MNIVSIDIGGTHARFAIATIAGGRVVSLGDAITLKTADHVSLQSAYQAFGAQYGGPLPRAAAIALASPITGAVIKLTNNPWIIQRDLMGQLLNVDNILLINDFGAIGHAVAQVDATALLHLCGPDTPLPDSGSITICGPGTGLGVAQLLRVPGGYHVVETEGGHGDFAPLDDVEAALVQRLRAAMPRVSAERVCSGPAIVAIYETLAAIEGRPVNRLDDKTLWDMAFAGTDTLANAALDRFCMMLGAVAGNLTLAHGPRALVIAGGLGLRLRDRLIAAGFEQRFTAKGRFESLMRTVPVKLIIHPEPGLFGAAAAFAQEHCQ